MPGLLNVILVMLVSLLMTAGSINMLHHHTDDDLICFCTDCDGADSCNHHKDDNHSHEDSDSCPFRLDEFNLASHNDSTACFHVSMPVTSVIQAEASVTPCCEHIRCYRCHVAYCYKGPDINYRGLRSPPAYCACA